MFANLHDVRLQVENAARVSPPALNEFDQQSLRILRCAARAMASHRSGFSLRMDSQLWLDDLSGGSLALRTKAAAVDHRTDRGCVMHEDLQQA